MPVRIYDIAKKLGVESKEVLAKAKELGITAARVPSSSLDKITAEYLEQHLESRKPQNEPAPHAPPEPIIRGPAPPVAPGEPVPGDQASPAIPASTPTEIPITLGPTEIPVAGPPPAVGEPFAPSGIDQAAQVKTPVPPPEPAPPPLP